jgi:predicted acetyltransferase
MIHRIAGKKDVDLLAEWNRQLIQDEGHRNTMSVEELRKRMDSWIAGEYTAIIFEIDSVPVAYALYLEKDDEIYLRQFFVDREKRRNGIGRQAIQLLRNQIWDTQKRLKLEVLVGNESAITFWHSVGYKDYSISMEFMP